MSGTMSPTLASAASAYAIHAQAAARCLPVGHLIAERARAVSAAKQGAKTETLAGQTWREMPLRVRTVLVMLESTAEGDPRSIAMQPWGSFTEGDQCAMGACARALAQGLANAAYLR